MIFTEKLPSGLTVEGLPMEEQRSVSVGLWVNAGSLHERPEENGISHFIEHMLFKGTERRSARDIAEEMDGVGGNLNAFTAKDCTCFYATVVDEHLPLALDLLFDMVFHPSLLPPETEREKGVVAEEIAMVEDTPEDVSGELLAAAYFGSHPLGQAILGPVENVMGFTGEGIRDYMRRFYQPDNMVLAIAGHFDRERLDALLEEQLQRIPSVRPAASTAWTAAAPCGGRILRPRPVEQVHLNLAVPGLARTDPRYRAMLVLNNLLGGGMSSRLFQRIREERGLAYSVYSYPMTYEKCGVTTLYAGLNAENLPETLEMILGEMEALREGRFTEAEFTRSREQLKGNYILGLDTAASWMMGLGKSTLLYHRVRSEDEVLAEIRAVTREDVQETARLLLRPEQAAVSIVGPEGVDYDGILDRAGLKQG